MKQALGYARVSAVDQTPDLQVDELTGARCHRVFVERASGARTGWPQLAEVLDRLRSGEPREAPGWSTRAVRRCTLRALRRSVS